MYESFYGFKEKPFSMLPDPGFLFLSKKHQSALTLLEYGLLNHVGFCVISGEPGAGKTTILRAMLERVSDDVTIGLITNTHQSFGGLLDWVLSAFDLHRPNLTHVEMHQVFMDYLIKEYANDRSVLLIVDEAQNMSADSLEELRMLSNVNTEKDQLLQIVLAGQPALKDMLRKPELMQFAQRIAVDYHLDPLSLEETCGYIQHRLFTSGAKKDVFTPAACARIYNYSGGSPRLINLLCETVLVYGFADQLEVIDVDLVDEMVHERMKDSVVPIVNRDVTIEENEEAVKRLKNAFPSIISLVRAQKAADALKAEHALKKQQALKEQRSGFNTHEIGSQNRNVVSDTKHAIIETQVSAANDVAPVKQSTNEILKSEKNEQASSFDEADDATVVTAKKKERFIKRPLKKRASGEKKSRMVTINKCAIY